MTTGNHTFLHTLPVEERAAAIAKVDQWKLRSRIAATFPGQQVHGLDWDRAMHEADLDWDLVEMPVFAKGKFTAAIPGYKALARKESHAPVSIVKQSYGVIQNSTAFSGLKGLVDTGHATLESLYSMNGGCNVGAVAFLGTSKLPTRLGGDSPETFAHYAIAKNSHDGSGSFTWTRYTAQLKCLNGLFSTQRHSSVAVRHSKNGDANAKAAMNAVGSLIANALAEMETLAEMAQARMDLGSFLLRASEILRPEGVDALTERQVKNHRKELEELGELFEHGQGNVGQSQLDGYSAITEWLTPRRAQYADAAKYATRFFNNEAGRSATIRERAMAILRRA